MEEQKFNVFTAVDYALDFAQQIFIPAVLLTYFPSREATLSKIRRLNWRYSEGAPLARKSRKGSDDFSAAIFSKKPREFVLHRNLSPGRAAVPCKIELVKVHLNECTAKLAHAQPSPLLSRTRRIPSRDLLKAYQGPELGSRRKTRGTKAQAFLKQTWHDLSFSVLYALNEEQPLKEKVTGYYFRYSNHSWTRVCRRLSISFCLSAAGTFPARR